MMNGFGNKVLERIINSSKAQVLFSTLFTVIFILSAAQQAKHLFSRTIFSQRKSNYLKYSSVNSANQVITII